MTTGLGRSFEVSLDRIADSLRQIESNADLSSTLDLSPLGDDLSKIADEIATTNERLEAIDTHLVEIIGAIPELARLIATGMPTLIKALKRS